MQLQSPEKLQQMLEDMHAALERERALVAEAERRHPDLQAQQEVIAKVYCAFCVFTTFVPCVGLVTRPAVPGSATCKSTQWVLGHLGGKGGFQGCPGHG